MLVACAEAPPKSEPCIRVEEIQARTEKVKELTTLLKADTELLGDVSQNTRYIGQRFQRLARAYETATPQSLVKLQKRREELEAEASANEIEGNKIRSRLQLLQAKLDEELRVLDSNRPTCLPRDK